MFCMYCGQVLPDGARFCMQCGTPQGQVAPAGTVNSGSINPSANQTFVPAMCPNCNAHMEVNTNSKIARCNSCGTECLVQDAIKTLNVHGNVNVASATINVNGGGPNVDSLLQRVELLIADGHSVEARQRCESILDMDPTNGKVYLYMLMIDCSCSKPEKLAEQHFPFDENTNYIKAMKYGNDDLRNQLDKWLSVVLSRNEMIIKNPSRGDVIHYGNYRGHRLWWRVLKVESNKALIISNESVLKLPYHKPGHTITWEGCTLRKWLNEVFVENCFTPEERNRILTNNILSNPNNPFYSTPGGETTTDSVFLLSINEAMNYFPSNAFRKADDSWWLRTPGSDSTQAVVVSNDGSFDNSGKSVNVSLGVRPALWMMLDN